MRSERGRSSIGPGSRGAAAADVVRVTVVAGLPSPAKSDLVEALASRAPYALVVHEPRAAGPEGLLARLCSDRKRRDAIAVLLPGSEPRLYAARWSEIAKTRPSIRIERIVTSVEVATLRGELASLDSLASRGWATGPCDGRSVADLAVEQIEFADALLLNSGPGAAGRDRNWSEELAAALNAHAARIDASACRLDPRLLDGAPHFAFGDTVRAARWFRALDNRGSGLEDARVLRFDARAPFHPGRLGALLSGRPGRFVRAKGLCWISNEPEYALGLSVAGARQSALSRESLVGRTAGRVLAGESGSARPNFRGLGPTIRRPAAATRFRGSGPRCRRAAASARGLPAKGGGRTAFCGRALFRTRAFPRGF